MKQIMASESTSAEQGVASFGFNPLDDERSGRLFDLHTPIDDLADELRSHFAGRALTAAEIYHEHSLGKDLTFKNYQDALRKLEEGGLISADPPAEKRTRSGIPTFGKNVKVTFLPKKG